MSKYTQDRRDGYADGVQRTTGILTVGSRNYAYLHGLEAALSQSLERVREQIAKLEAEMDRAARGEDLAQDLENQ